MGWQPAALAVGYSVAIGAWGGIMSAFPALYVDPDKYLEVSLLVTGAAAISIGSGYLSLSRLKIESPRTAQIAAFLIPFLLSVAYTIALPLFLQEFAQSEKGGRATPAEARLLAIGAAKGLAIMFSVLIAANMAFLGLGRWIFRRKSAQVGTGGAGVAHHLTDVSDS